MAAAAILNVKKLLPFFYYRTDPHQIWWECCKFSLLLCWQTHIHKFQDSTCRHLEFRKKFAVSSLLDWSAPNLVRMLQILYRTHCLVENAHSTIHKMVAAAIVNSEKLSPFLYHWTDHHQIWWESCRLDIKRNRHIEIAHFTKLKMAAGRRHLELRKLLPFLNYWTDLHQIWWESWFGVNLANSILNTTVMSKTHIHLNSRWRLPPSWIANKFLIT